MASPEGVRFREKKWSVQSRDRTEMVVFQGRRRTMQVQCNIWSQKGRVKLVGEANRNRAPHSISAQLAYLNSILICNKDLWEDFKKNSNRA